MPAAGFMSSRWKADLHPLLRPRSIAVVGASERGRGPRVIESLKTIGFGGKIYPVNPKYREVLGLRCYSSILEIDGEIDCAAIQIPAEGVLEVVHQCAEKNIKAVAINTAGFGETHSEAGESFQKELVRIAGEAQIRVCGPNCMGLVSPCNRAAIYFFNLANVAREVAPGPLGIISQSGSLMMAILHSGTLAGASFSHLISSGNEAVLELSNYLDYMVEDPHTRVIGLIVEGFRDTENLKRVANAALEREKPIIVLKIGRSRKGEESTLAHTGALAGADAAYEAFFKKFGWIRVGDVDDFLTTAIAFTKRQFPQGRRLAVLGSSGGTTALCADLCEEFGLELPDLDPQTAKEIKLALPEFISAKNPLDMGPPSGESAKIVQKCVRILPDSGLFDMVVTVSSQGGLGSLDRHKAAAEVAREKSIPFATILASSEPLAPEAQKSAREDDSLLLQDLRRGLRAVRRLADYSDFKNKDHRDAETSVAAPREALLEAKRFLAEKKILGERQAKELLSLYDICVAREELALNLQEALAAAAGIGYPVALKIESPDILHKTEAGGVFLGIRDPQELERAYRQLNEAVNQRLPQAKINGVLVQEMVEGGIELILGIHHDRQFGPLLLCGFGGILAELLRDTTMRLCPVSESDAREMVSELRAVSVLTGYRGAARRDLESVIAVILSLSRLACDLMPAMIQTVDINPLAVFSAGQGAKVVDALVVTPAIDAQRTTAGDR